NFWTFFVPINMMDSIYKIYFLLPHDSTLGILSKGINRIAAKIIKQLFDIIVPLYFRKSSLSSGDSLYNSYREKRYSVTLTSFPARINDVWIVVECLFRQVEKADKIILWLSTPQFEGIKIPERLLAQQKRGLEIKFVEDDLRSHKKYLYAFEAFPNDYIIT